MMKAQMMKARMMKAGVAGVVFSILAPGPASAQFVDPFDAVKTDRQGVDGWRFVTGDGTATVDFRQGGEGYASIFVDATTDKRGIWWALVGRTVSGAMDLGRLQAPGHEVRIEARIRVSHAPRRVNLHVATQRTTDHHSHLMEFDIPDTTGWHTISMTTRGFDARPGDRLTGHIALIDWGLEKYRVDLDYLRVDVVNPATAGPDKGTAVPYHPPIPDPRTFTESVTVAHDSMIDIEHTDQNLNDWSAQDGARTVRLLTVDGTHYAILRWDLSAFAGRTVAGHGLLELTTHAVQRKAQDVKDFGLMRVVEILGGDPRWDQKTVTTDGLCRDEPLSRVLNTQMIIDWPVTAGEGGKTYLTISNPVLQRLIDGKTLGIAIKPLGAISAAFHAMENDGAAQGARLRFNLK